MSFYLRSSIKVGPFRCGLSRSGLSVSTGVPGLRVGAGPRGAFVRVGAAGVHSYLTVPSRRQPTAARRNPPASPTFTGSAGIELEDITGVGAAQLLPATPSELVESLNTAASRHSIWPWVLAVTVVLTFAVSPLMLILGVPALVAAVWSDRVRRTVVMFYEVDGAPAAQYQDLLTHFAAAIATKKAWHTVAQGALRTTHQRKVNAGASALVRREALARSLAGPPQLASNIAIPTLQSSSRSIYLLPDRALVRDGSRYADVSYDELRAAAGPDRFIETGTVPSDATVVDTTWEYVNKKGGPDKRFKNNRRLPVVLYGEVTLSTRTGMSTVLSFSRYDAAPVLASAIESMKAPAPSLPVQHPASEPVTQLRQAPRTPARELPSRLPHPVRPDATPASSQDARSGSHRVPVTHAAVGATVTPIPAPAAPPVPVEFVPVSSDGRLQVVGESHYQPALARAARGRTAEYEVASHIPAQAVLVPEPSNPYDRHAVRVDVLGDGDPATVGYISRDLAPAYHAVLGTLAPGTFATCPARITGGGPKYYGIYLHLADAADLGLSSPGRTTAAHSVSLAPETSCTVTGEENHQDYLRTCLRDARGATRVVTELGWCPIRSGKYSGQTAIEVRINGARVGQLTYAMTQRYAESIRSVEQSGRTPTAEALLADGPRGIQVELRLPRTTS
ncbi:DUF4236 domain-containing protein [Pseudonocardia bannensis]|uniref:DUF4236 domain-containing protein n=1 Tax=Pseudonocardia bannensis TaxID=630973 RepID=A0A848DH24_9PSEU|nr:DUF4236 domain-containing protein [Pseudonocardia bannensis]